MQFWDYQVSKGCLCNQSQSSMGWPMIPESKGQRVEPSYAGLLEFFDRVLKSQVVASSKC